MNARRFLSLGLLLALCAEGAWAGYRLTGVSPLTPAGLSDKGSFADPQWSPDGRSLSYEFLGAGGDTAEAYTAEFFDSGGPTPHLGAAVPVVAPAGAAKDPFALRSTTTATVSESVAWGPPKGKGQRLAVAATRQAVERGAPLVNFDLYLSEPGRKRFLTTSTENDAHPAFSPDGEYLAFSSGLTGQGDVYLYHFFADADPLVQLTFEPGGPELYPAWDPGGGRLAYVGHLGGTDHVYVIDDVRKLAGERDPARRRSLARTLARDLTPGRKMTCLAPSFSPDGKWVAFFSREKTGEEADLYVVSAAGGEPRRVVHGALPENRRGPRWTPQGDGFVVVLESAEKLNPLAWVPLSGGPPVELASGTQLNADPCPKKLGDSLYLVFTAQGGTDSSQKRWRKLYWGRLVPDRTN